MCPLSIEYWLELLTNNNRDNFELYPSRDL
jgi:hypothetical protein